MLRLGVVLLIVGLGPLLLQQTLLPDIDTLVPVMLSFMVAPLGAVCLAAGLILFLVAWVRQRPGSS